MRSELKVVRVTASEVARRIEGKVGVPILLWFLGVPGGIVLLLWFFIWRNK